MAVQTIVDAVKRSLAECQRTISWRRVTMPGLQLAWVGMNVPDIDSAGRPWVWEVVTPQQYESDARLQEDPLVLSVAHDTVITEINHVDHTGPIMRMQVPVRTTPHAITLKSGLSASSPWSLRLETGWTVQALGSAAQCWIDEEVPGGARLDIPEPVIPEENKYALLPSVDFESAAFDRLLTLDPNDAAVVTSLLSRVHSALQPYR